MLNWGDPGLSDWFVGTLFEGYENADVSIAVTLSLGARAVLVEEGFDAACEAGWLFPIDMDN